MKTSEKLNQHNYICFMLRRNIVFLNIRAMHECPYMFMGILNVAFGNF